MHLAIYMFERKVSIEDGRGIVMMVQKNFRIRS